MPRPKSPCGTRSAYERHIRNHEPVDAACRLAQQKYDAGRGAARRAGDVETPTMVAVPAPMPDPAVQRRDGLQARYLELTRKLTAATLEAADGYLYDVIDTFQEMDDLLDDWCEAQDDVDYSRGYPHLPAELREQLIAARENPATEPSEN